MRGIPGQFKLFRGQEFDYSGMNFDRFLDRFDESTLLTMKRHYWTAKQLLRTKLGKKVRDYGGRGVMGNIENLVILTVP